MTVVNIKTIYYRGHLRSCNYRCPYCPFRSGQYDLAADEAALNKFCAKISEFGNELTIMLIPHGEAMIHEYYHKAIAALCRYEHVKTVGCQTNLSFNVKNFADNIKDYNYKVSLWCTFHPSQVKLDTFLRQCGKLYDCGIKFCAGAVGHPVYIPLLKEMRSRLPEDIYMWVNALKGFGRDYTKEEVADFIGIDPFFKLELQEFIADSKLCIAGRESVFTDGNGDIFACNISKVRLGNLYAGEKIKTESICKAEKCSCYLAYSNRIEVPRGVRI